MLKKLTNFPTQDPALPDPFLQPNSTIMEIMEEKFNSWLVRTEGKLEATGRSYSRAIHKLSEHYSSSTGTRTDIYKVDLKLLEKINNDYESDGRFSEHCMLTGTLYLSLTRANLTTKRFTKV